MATRQNSTNGKPKSPRIQVVLPELICEQLNILAENESRTVSNMAKVLIQQGIKNHLKREAKSQTSDTISKEKPNHKHQILQLIPRISGIH